METIIADFDTNFYIPSIGMLEFHPTPVIILGDNYCGNTHHEALKNCRQNKYVLCCRYYDERLVASFVHQMQSEYYCGNRSMFIEGIALEHFGEKARPETATTPQARTRHAVFHSF